MIFSGNFYGALKESLVLYAKGKWAMFVGMKKIKLTKTTIGKHIMDLDGYG